jgi:hypothetical protein
MTPKEKAEELVNKYLDAEFGIIQEYIPNSLLVAKQCALIAVDEMIEQCKDANFGGFGLYWQQVKTEIEKL